MKYINRLLASGAALALLTTTAPTMAECVSAKNETAAQQKTDEAVPQARTDPRTGDKKAATGAAKPAKTTGSEGGASTAGTETASNACAEPRKPS